MGLGRNHYRGVPEYGYTEVMKTTKTVHVYADADAGNDSYNGLFWSSPKKTLDAVFNVLPHFIEHNCVIHIRGVFDTETNADTLYLSKHLAQGIMLIIDGGIENKTVITGSYTADLGSTSSIGYSSLSMTEDAYAGYLLEVLDGPAAGQIRTIQGNDTTTFTPTKKFSANPTGGSFRVYRPSTHIQSTIIIGGSGEGYYQLQNLYLHGDDNNLLSIYRCACHLQASACVSNSNNTYAAIQISSSSAGFTGVQYSIEDFSLVDVNLIYAGMGVVSRNPLKCTAGSNVGGFSASVFGNVDIYESLASTTAIGFGTRIIGKLDISNIGPATAQHSFIFNYSAHPPIRIGGSSAQGIVATDSYLVITGEVAIENNTSHGIELVNATMRFNSTVTGGGNTGAGLYAHSNSVALIKDGTNPTLSGTVGDVSTDGVTQASTWTAIDGGTPVVSMTEMTIIKEF